MKTTLKSSSGVAHYIAQRVTALALIPLSFWFVLFVMQILDVKVAASTKIGMNNQLYDSCAHAMHLLSSPVHIVLAMSFATVSLYHGFLGMRVIIEDYVHNHSIRTFCMLLLFFITIITVVFSVFAMLSFYLTIKNNFFIW